MTIRHSILTLVVAGLAWAAPAAQAHLLVDDSANISNRAVSTQSVLSVMTIAGIRFHAAANYKNERFLGQSGPTHVSPDNRPGPRGI